MLAFVKLFLVFYWLFLFAVSIPASGSPYGNAIDFDITVQLNDETLSAVDQLRVDEICALGIHFDDTSGVFTSKLRGL